jgi:hypothetical protein
MEGEGRPDHNLEEDLTPMCVCVSLYESVSVALYESVAVALYESVCMCVCVYV